MHRTVALAEDLDQAPAGHGGRRRPGFGLRFGFGFGFPSLDGVGVLLVCDLELGELGNLDADVPRRLVAQARKTPPPPRLVLGRLELLRRPLIGLRLWDLGLARIGRLRVRLNRVRGGVAPWAPQPALAALGVLVFHAWCAG